MTPFDAAHEILTDADTLDVSTIKAAVSAAMLVASDDLPVPTSAMSVSVSKRAKKRLGQCKYKRRTTGFGQPDEVVPFEINISLAGAALASRRELADTIAHEVAHAVAGHKANHGPFWQGIARKYGATPTACSEDETVTRSYRYAYYCAECERVTGRQAGKIKYRRRCNECYEFVAFVDLRERKIVPGHSLTVPDERASETFTDVVRPVIEDYHDATAAILTLARTA